LAHRHHAGLHRLHPHEGWRLSLPTRVRDPCALHGPQSVSQNCIVSSTKHPLLRKADATNGDNDDENKAADPPFNGIIYANGTNDEAPPAGFHLGRVEIWRSGTTVFDIDSNNNNNNNNNNGTVSVLSVDPPNPDFASEVL
jgi:hypothetical protein